MTNRLTQIKVRIERFNAMGWSIHASRHAADNLPYVSVIRNESTMKEAEEAADLLAQIHNVDLPWLVEQAERIERFEADIAKNAERRREGYRRRYVRDE